MSESFLLNLRYFTLLTEHSTEYEPSRAKKSSLISKRNTRYDHRNLAIPDHNASFSVKVFQCLTYAIIGLNNQRARRRERRHPAGAATADLSRETNVCGVWDNEDTQVE